MSHCVIPQSMLRQNCHRASRSKPANVQRQCDASVNEPDFSLDQRIRAQVRGWYIFPCSNPIPSMSHQLLSHPRPHRNQSLVYFNPKPGLSNLALFITPVIRPLLPHRTTCPVPSKFTPTLHPVQRISLRFSSWGQQRPTCFYLMSREPLLSQSELAPAPCGEG